MLNLGIVRPGSTISIPFSTFDKDDGSSITMTNFAAGDVLIYKDGGTTERASTAGITATTDFDAKTGKHLIVIDLSDNTTAGFYAAGSEYVVAVDAVTVDAVTTGGWVARFTIGYPGANHDTTIATLASQTSFTLTAGPAEDDALNGQWAIIHDVASAVQRCQVLISDYTGSTKTVTLAAAGTFTAAATDNISIMGMAPLQPATLGRTLNVDTSGRVLLQGGLRRNVALSKFTFLMTDSTNHNPATGLTVSGSVRKDGGSSASLTDSVTELANGLYEVDLSATEMDAAVVTLRFTATGADDLAVTLLTDA